MSLGNRVIKYAIESGYYADEAGNVYNPSGKVMKAPANSTGYRTLSIPHSMHERGFSSILVHRFVAAYFNGTECLSQECVRHLDDNRSNNRRDNLSPGTFKQNRADIPREVLSKAAKKNSHLLVERSRRLSDEDVKSMRKDRKSTGMSYAKLAKKYSVATMTAYRCCTGESWSGEYYAS